MTRHQVEITGGPLQYRVLIDGVDIAHGVSGLTVRMQVGAVPEVELDLELIDVTQLGSIEAEVMLGASVHETLVALGWTPPEGAA